MNELIEALQIFAKYTETKYPTHCEHDVLHVLVDPENVSDEDKNRLEELGFINDEEFECFASYRYGSG